MLSTGHVGTVQLLKGKSLERAPTIPIHLASLERAHLGTSFGRRNQCGRDKTNLFFFYVFLRLFWLRRFLIAVWPLCTTLKRQHATTTEIHTFAFLFSTSEASSAIV